MLVKLFWILTIVYFILADPIRDTPKKSVDYGKMSCRIRQITHPEEFDQEIINPLPIHLIPSKLEWGVLKKNINFFIYCMFLYFNFWNKDVCMYKSWTKFVAVSLVQWKNLQLFLTCNKVVLRSIPIREPVREKNIFCYTLTVFIIEYYVFYKTFQSALRRMF